MRWPGKSFIALLLCMVSVTAGAVGKASHVVVIVWDGMRPDFVTEETTPTLFKLAHEGVTFQNHHSSYLSTTEVNGAVLATGVYPGEDGIIGNREYRPAIDALNNFMTAKLAAVRRGDEVTGNHYLGFPTVAELLHVEGKRTAIAGAKPVALLQDRLARFGNSPGMTLFEDKVLPKEYGRKLTDLLGAFPPLEVPKTNRDLWATKALIGPMWEDGVPPFSLLWLSEPDYSQHITGLGSPTSRLALKSSDENLARVLAALEQSNLREKTDVIVVSDHGFSTIAQTVDIAARLRERGFRSYREAPDAGPRTGDVMVVGNGGSAFLYVIGHDQRLVWKIVHFLQGQPFCGVVFTQQPVEGAFTLRDARIDSSSAPDIVLAFRWQPDKNTNGAPGMIDSEAGEYSRGQGMHGSLSPHDLHCICIAYGPDFCQGAVDDMPTGNVDIAPTLLWILGLEPKHKLSGRVLHEALLQGSLATPSCQPRHLEATFGGKDFVWHQYLDYSELNGVVYLEGGNGEQLEVRHGPGD